MIDKFLNNYLFLKYLGKPILVSTVIFCVHFILINITQIQDFNFYNHFLKVLIISMFTWILISTVNMTKKMISVDSTYANFGNHLDIRRINTKIDILTKIIIRIIIIVGIASVLVTFDAIRDLGISILASAGVAGVILGFAAQKILSNILSGIQIAFTQPIKIGDEIVIENDGGIVEEINLTYVVICTFDKRRLIIPINNFIEKSFQNLTRNSLATIGVIFIDLDYSTNIENIRSILNKILKDTDLWDGKLNRVQVNNLKIRTIEIKILISASNSSNMGNLKSYIREKLIEFLIKDFPNYIPKVGNNCVY